MRGNRHHHKDHGTSHASKRPRSASAPQTDRLGASHRAPLAQDARRGGAGSARGAPFTHAPSRTVPARAAQTTSASHSVTPTTAPKLFHPFPANFNDHFETSRSALEDVLPVVHELRQLLRPSTPEKFTLYDPYYCSGTVVEHWHSLGVQNVLHANRDFYEDVRLHTVPGLYDMLVTNPPFSDDHIIRMLNILVQQQNKPWAFLAPDYIAAKPWYKAFVRRHFSAAPPTGKGNIHAPRQAIPTAVTFALPPFLRDEPPDAAKGTPSSPPASADASARGECTPAGGDKTAATSSLPAPTTSSSSAAEALPTEPFYLVPRATYDFEHPTGAGHAHSHFKSMWYCWCGASLRRQQEVMRGAKVALLSRHVDVVHGLVALKESGLVSALLK